MAELNEQIVSQSLKVARQELESRKVFEKVELKKILKNELPWPSALIKQFNEDPPPSNFATIREKLSKVKGYFTVYYAPKAEGKGGDFTFFFEEDTGKLIGEVRGR